MTSRYKEKLMILLMFWRKNDKFKESNWRLHLFREAKSINDGNEKALAFVIFMNDQGKARSERPTGLPL